MKKTLQEPKTTLKYEEPKRNFIILYDSVYKNNDLTANELKLLIKLIASAPTFKPTSRKLADILKIDLKSLNRASKGLQAKGYLKIKKFGKSSEWTITQNPIENKIDNFNKESLLNGLLNYIISVEELNLLHKLKRIDDRLYIAVMEDYSKELVRIAHINAYDDNY